MKLIDLFTVADLELNKVKWDTDEHVNEAEEAVYVLWKVSPSKAQQLWELKFPQAVKGVLPSFIRRKAMQEGFDFE